jgi:hypothetical protein
MDREKDLIELLLAKPSLFSLTLVSENGKTGASVNFMYLTCAPDILCENTCS